MPVADRFPTPVADGPGGFDGVMRVVQQRQLDPPRQADFDSNGRAEIVTDRVPDGVQWEIELISVRASGGTPELNVWRNQEREENWLDGTENGGGDVAEYTNGLVLMPHDRLVLVWTSGTDGERASVNIQKTAVKWIPIHKMVNR